jgi:membrane associated rhomboid family serine protease
MNGGRAVAGLGWALSLVVVWFAVSRALGQPPFAPRLSSRLVAFGAFRGDGLGLDTAWRLVVSQWLHVHFEHMAWNAVVIAALGSALARRTSATTMLLIGIGGGSVGQLASAVLTPEAYVSGASQASLALAAAIIVMRGPRQPTWCVAIIATVVAAALDLRVGGVLKAGHLAGFAAGAIAGAALRWHRSSPAAARALHRHR